MDITGLSVSVKVDMSGFQDSMLQLLAIIETMVEELDELTQKLNTAFSSIKISSDDSKESLDGVQGSIKGIVDVTLDLKELYDIFKKMGTIGEVLEVGASTEGLGLVGLAILHLIKLYEDLGEVKHKALAHVPDKIPPQTKTSAPTNSAGAKAVDGKFAHPLYKPDTGVASDAASVSIPMTKAAVTEDKRKNENTESTTQPTSPTASTNEYDTAFVDKVKHTYEELKKAFPTGSDLIKISGNAEITNKHIPDAQPKQDSTSQTESVNGEQQITTAIDKETAAHQGAADGAKKHSDALKALGDYGAQAIEGLAEGIGQMAAGRNVNLGAIMVQMLGDAVESYGKQLIAVSGIMALGADPLSIPKLAEGTALVALGAGLKAIKMAEGGIVHGSTFANIGEYAGASHNPEVVAPLDKLRSMMGGGGGGTLTHTIQGSDLLLVLNKEMSNQGYSSGGNGLQQFSQ